MGFESNESKDFKKFVGVTRVKVLTINPTLKELNAIGVNFKDEPVYSGTTQDGKKYVSVNFWVKNENLTTPIKFIIRPEVDKSKDGRIRWIDKYGNTEYTSSKDLLSERVEKVSAKQAYVGEADLISFIKTWINVKKGGEASLDVAKIIKGDFSELKQLGSANGIWCMATVANNKYQNIYSRFFVRGWVSEEEVKAKFLEHINKQKDAGYPLKDAYSIDYKEYSEVTPDAEVASTPSVTASKDFNDLPW